jgi:hypothetical protein
MIFSSYASSVRALLGRAYRTSTKQLPDDGWSERSSVRALRPRPRGPTCSFEPGITSFSTTGGDDVLLLHLLPPRAAQQGLPHIHRTPS